MFFYKKLQPLILPFIVLFLSCNAVESKNQEKNIYSKFINTTSLIDTTNRPFKIVFKNIKEKQIGSKYNTCNIEFIGTDKIQLPAGLWQDKLAWTDDSEKLVLVKWDNESKIPIFKFYIIYTQTGKIKKSIQIVGAINNLTIKADTIKYNKFYNKSNMASMTKNDSLCCNVEENLVVKE